MGCGSSKSEVSITVQLNSYKSEMTGVHSVDDYVRRQNDLITSLAHLTDSLDRKRTRLAYLTGYNWT